MKTLIHACSLIPLALYSTQILASDELEKGIENKQSEKSIYEYWTPERLMNAKEMPYPKVDPNAVQEIDIESLQLEKPQQKEGTPPAIEIEPDKTPLIPQTMINLESTLSEHFFNRGTSGANFTSSRLVPLSADLSYPFSAVGKLYFTVPGQGDAVCSASTIGQRIVLTAGHCVHSGTSSGYYTNFVFIPAYRDGNAPYRAWSWKFVLTTSEWATGGGVVPNAADYAMIEVNDKVINGSTTRLGLVTGMLGWIVNALIPNHAHLLGYPCNLDYCAKMHQVMSQSFRAVSPNNVEYGSDMRGGSSGGPWVQNFGIAAFGQTGGSNTARNAIVGVTSYGYIDSNIMLQGSSVLDSRFSSLRNRICAHRAGNCT
ncbi:trypsin-like serine peptidase [Legionella hackeliae]|uniref:Peptidase S1 domain-containing protein n=1 Tax=Legionella hackeliae TaxID=449 RepID=A0A0A8URS9_LEGHA|nr:trypsin-like serine protease [Legionella hackeliae]KTD08777.1 Trypsin [Legionella hackeliae]CEK10206.1 conserved exported protein of unknown function [Legionella hackeliae]STX46932.1 V8-like Glu-specific endopeptidase [Legionella hackeliae]